MKKRCLRCGHVWESRSVKPRVCPKCKSPYWDRPTKKLSKELVESMAQNVIRLHDKIIKASGGVLGIRDVGGLHNAVYILLRTYQLHYKSPAKVGATIFQDLAKRHHFMDGNKRTAYCFAKSILMSMGKHLKVNYKEAIPFILKIASHKNLKTSKEIEVWLKKNLENIKADQIDKYLKELTYDIMYEKKGEAN